MKRGAVIIIITLAVCGAMWLLSPKEEYQTVKTVHPNLSDIIYSVSAGGKIEQIRAASLYSSGYATVQRIYVNPGDTVKKGQVLITLQPADGIAPEDSDLSDLLTEVFAQTISKESAYASYSNSNQIVSPIDGIVTEIGIKEMETVSPVIKCAVVSDVSRMQAVVSVSESDISKVKRGMPAGITGDAFKGTYNGVVLEISQQIKSELTIQGEGDRYAEVVIELFDADKKVLPGSSVLAKIYTSKKQGVLTLPYEAVTQDSGNKEVVYAVYNGKVVKKVVETGYELSNLVEIKSGITEKDEVILAPSEEYQEGDKVVVRN